MEPKEKFCWTPCCRCGRSVEVYESEVGTDDIVCIQCEDDEWSTAESEDNYDDC